MKQLVALNESALLLFKEEQAGQSGMRGINQECFKKIAKHNNQHYFFLKKTAWQIHSSEKNP